VYRPHLRPQRGLTFQTRKFSVYSSSSSPPRHPPIVVVESSSISRAGDYAAATSSPLRHQPPPEPSRTSSQVAVPERGLFPKRTWTCQTSTSTRPCPRGIRRDSSHHATRSNQRTGSTTMRHSRPPLTTTAGAPCAAVRMYTCSMDETVGWGSDIQDPPEERGRQTKTPPPKSFDLK
jgi:hypothetical protein